MSTNVTMFTTFEGLLPGEKFSPLYLLAIVLINIPILTLLLNGLWQTVSLLEDTRRRYMLNLEPDFSQGS